MFNRQHYRDRVVPVLVLKAYGEWRCIAPQNLTTVLVGGEWSASCSDKTKP